VPIPPRRSTRPLARVALLVALVPASAPAHAFTVEMPNYSCPLQRKSRQVCTGLCESQYRDCRSGCPHTTSFRRCAETCTVKRTACLKKCPGTPSC
jgi:hypothetical protein